MIPRLTSTGCRDRRRALLEATSLDLIVLTNPRHVYYYSGFLSSELSLSGWGPAYLVIERHGGTTLLAHNFSAANALEAAVDETKIWTWYDATRKPGVPIWREGARVAAEFLGSFTNGATSVSVGIEHGSFPTEVLPAEIASRDVTEVILRQRRRKEPDELAVIDSIVAVTGVGHQRARDVLRGGMTEMELYGEILQAVTAEAGEPVNMICDLLSGERVANIAGRPTSRVIAEGDPVILDLNPYVAGYRADYTATLLLENNVPEVYQRLEDALHNALAAGEARLRPGIRAGDVFLDVRKAIESSGFPGCFDHHAGHGIGLGHPEPPYFVPESDEKLIAGDVVTLEPGAYGEDFGARIEHNYVVTEDGPRRLSSHDTQFLLYQ